MKRLVAALAGVALGMAPIRADAQVGDMLVAPTRVVFEGARRSAALSIVNKGPAPATYRIVWVQKRMSETGDLDDVVACGQGCPPASDIVRFSPREVRLPPGGSQTVRLVLRKPVDLPAGEYRSHLKIFTVPPASSVGSSVETDPDAKGGIRISLTPIYGISVPVIVRQGKLTAQARLEELKIVPGSGVRGSKAEKLLEFKIIRTGDRSIYGDFSVKVATGAFSWRTVAQAKGVAVYTPNLYRLVRLPLEERIPPNSRLIIEFEEKPEQNKDGMTVTSEFDYR